jgi:hypothetical protein
MPRDLSFHLTAPRPPGFAGSSATTNRPFGALLGSAVVELSQIGARNIAKGEIDSAGFINQKEELRSALKNGVPLASLAGRSGGKRILLSIYRDDLARSDAAHWLPPFDGGVCHLLLGADTPDMSATCRRQATNVFFAHFGHERLVGIQELSSRLREAYNEAGDSPWSYSRDDIFQIDGPKTIAGRAALNESLSDLIQRMQIPEDSAFAQLLGYELLLAQLKCVPFESDPACLLNQIVFERLRPAGEGYCLGAQALKIMVQRVAENNSIWPTEWSRWITKIGTDPRHARSNAEGTKWWGWATPMQLRLAQQGMVGLAIDFFLEGIRRSVYATEIEQKFAPRQNFLMGLFRAGKILEARVFLNPLTARGIDRKYLDPETMIIRKGDPAICLRCVDDIYIIEGTDNFALRGFSKTFPISGFWTTSIADFADLSMKIPQDKCPVYIRHGSGDRWIRWFIWDLGRVLKVEWGDITF